MLERAERDLYPDESSYCYDHPQDRGCTAILRRLDRKESQRSVTELRRYCQENPETPRCAAIPLLDDRAAPAAAAKVKSEAGPLFSPDPSSLFGGSSDTGTSPSDPGEQLGIGEMIEEE